MSTTKIGGEKFTDPENIVRPTLTFSVPTMPDDQELSLMMGMTRLIEIHDRLTDAAKRRVARWLSERLSEVE